MMPVLSSGEDNAMLHLPGSNALGSLHITTRTIIRNIFHIDTPFSTAALKQF